MHLITPRVSKHFAEKQQMPLQQTLSDNVREIIHSGKKAWADPDSAGRLSALTAWNENEKIQTRHRQSGRQVLDEITLWGHLCRSIVGATSTQQTNWVTAARCIWLVDVVKHKLRKLNDTVVIVTQTRIETLQQLSSNLHWVQLYSAKSRTLHTGSLKRTMED